MLCTVQLTKTERRIFTHLKYPSCNMTHSKTHAHMHLHWELRGEESVSSVGSGAGSGKEISHFSPAVHTTFLLRIHNNCLCAVKKGLIQEQPQGKKTLLILSVYSMFCYFFTYKTSQTMTEECPKKFFTMLCADGPDVSWTYSVILYVCIVNFKSIN